MAIGGLPTSPYESLKHGKNHLFAIGINTYQHFTPLLNARKDIEDLAQLLADLYSFDEIQLLSDLDATKDNIIDKLDGLRRQIDPEDRLLIYYSGHGFTDDDRGFWIPVDAEPNRVSSYIANAEVRDIIQSIRARHILLISDSCFSGSLLVRDVSSDMSGSAFEDWDRNPSRYAFISGGGVVSDGKPGENSPFAGGIMKHLRENDADAINICRLADQVTQEIRFNYNQQAEISPLFQAGHAGGQFVFVKKQTEKDEWESAVRHNTEGSYLEYLNKYPSGKYVKEAEQKLVDIADENEWESTTLRNAAFAYRQYLHKYPKGKHASEAENNLDRIESEDLKEKEVARKQEQARQFKIVAERKEKEIPSKPEPSSKPVPPKPLKEVLPSGKPLSPNSAKSNKYTNYIFFIIGAVVLIAGLWIWSKNRISPAPGSSALINQSDTTAEVPAITDNSREIEGKVLDSKSTPNPLAGATVTDLRNRASATTDENGNFKLSGAKDGDTLLTTYLNYSEAINIILKDQKSGIIQLREPTRSKENKTISGIIKDRFDNPIPGTYIKVLRAGKYQNEVYPGKDGKFKLTGVNEGDLLVIKTGRGTKKVTVTEQNEYEIKVN